jgi:hypothetical protein
MKTLLALVRFSPVPPAISDTSSTVGDSGPAGCANDCYHMVKCTVRVCSSCVQYSKRQPQMLLISADSSRALSSEVARAIC